MLRLRQWHAGYGGVTVLHGTDLDVATGTVHAVLGQNAAGKSTLIHSIAGLVRATSGRLHLDGVDLTRAPAHRRARAGIGLVPQGRRVFASLTVAEHLAVAHRRRTGVGDGGVAARAGVGDGGVAAVRAGPEWTPERVLDLLPKLAARLRHRGAQLSGGEQQMLAIARALLGQPRLLLLDEPTEGLAPVIAGQIRDLIAQLATDGLTIVLAAPQPALPLAVADQITVLTAGRTAGPLPAAAARADPAPLHAALTPGTRPATTPGGKP